MENNKPNGEPLRELSVPYAVCGEDLIDEGARAQMDVACLLPVARRGFLAPDAHVGYGLPVGGVLATEDAVVPWAVGVDIACRMKLSLVDADPSLLDGARGKLRNALVGETAFGIGSGFQGSRRRDHDVMDDPGWNDLEPSLRHLKDKAWTQVGSSGSGNHFVEWGEVELREETEGVPPGRYLALLSHSGSRGFGANVAQFYSKVAESMHPDLPREARKLAWLELGTEAGEAYWAAMNLAGRYAAANHDLIHKYVLKAAGFKPAAQIENHHNFAWRETHDGRELIVHRKGATPAGEGVLGIIPGSMADPGFIVRGKGDVASLASAAHGAGRRMSRKQAKETLTRSALKKLLAERDVELVSAGLDEAPMAYKNIREVIARQRDLIDIVGEFHPRLVRMAAGGKAED